MKKMKKILALAVWIAALGLLCASCDNGLDIQQAYTFSLETMPVQKRISVGETAEIRCTLVREGRYDGARYTIRYFQPDGRGELRMDDGTVFLPNDRYPLDREVFRLYYTSRSDYHRRLCRGQHGSGREDLLHVPERERDGGNGTITEYV